MLTSYQLLKYFGEKGAPIELVGYDEALDRDERPETIDDMYVPLEDMPTPLQEYARCCTVRHMLSGCIEDTCM
jgi:hypothetical protein